MGRRGVITHGWEITESEWNLAMANDEAKAEEHGCRGTEPDSDLHDWALLGYSGKLRELGSDYNEARAALETLSDSFIQCNWCGRIEDKEVAVSPLPEPLSQMRFIESYSPKSYGSQKIKPNIIEDPFLKVFRNEDEEPPF